MCVYMYISIHIYIYIYMNTCIYYILRKTKEIGRPPSGPDGGLPISIVFLGQNLKFWKCSEIEILKF
jgi:hypothetical protein